MKYSIENECPHKQPIRHTTTNSKYMAGRRKLFTAHEFTNYKPLPMLDSPIDDELHTPTHTIPHTIPFCQTTKLHIDIDYVSPLLNQTSLLSLDSKLGDITPDISIKFAHRNQLFLDLDDTLITHSSQQINPDDIYLHNSSFYVSIRPFTKLLLTQVSAHYDVIVYP